MAEALREIDKLYFPHQWQRRYPFDQVLEQHIKLFNEESKKVVKSIRCEFNVPYGLQAREKYDIFGIDLPDASPILIYIHGGYWQVKEITHSNQAFMAKALHKHKIKVIAIGYELCPDVTVKDIMTEIEIAVKRCMDYAKRCQSRSIYLYGHSVGAQLVASLFSQFINILSYEDRNLIKTVFLSCGLYDAIPLTETIINQNLKLTEESARLISPQYMNMTSPDHIVFHVITAELDSPAIIKQGQNFHDKLQKCKINSTLHLLEGEDHFTAVEKIALENFEVKTIMLNDDTNKDERELLQNRGRKRIGKMIDVTKYLRTTAYKLEKDCGSPDLKGLQMMHE